MNTVSKMTMTLALTAIGAFANDHLIQLRDQAVGLERDFRDIHTAAKSKNFDAGAMEARVSATTSGVDKLKALAVEFESATPHLAQGQDWKITKDLVALISIFHTQKAQLMGPDLKKNKGMLKAHAEGLAKRAALLQQSTNRLLKTLGS